MQEIMSIFDPDLFPEQYDKNIERLVGRLVLCYGQIDRLLASAIIKISNGEYDESNVIDLFRGGQRKTIGNWIDWFENKPSLEKEAAGEIRNHLEKMKSLRDKVTHDTLMYNTKGHLQWKTNQRKRTSTRDHTLFDREDLRRAQDDFDAFKHYVFGLKESCIPAPDGVQCSYGKKRTHTGAD